ncbi:deoxyuridine 5'-triphosphate nucleotidohydrolase [Halogranum rubrum]|nr:deoxyuridine 5'-triphosphate nucleotidohydrolase [Halogranum salarium]
MRRASRQRFPLPTEASTMFKSGSFVAEHVSPLTEAQIQPNGVDLTLDTVFEQLDPGRIGVDGKEIGERQPIEREERGDDGADSYYLPAGGYIVQYAERVRIPEGHVGFIYPRSSLMRNSCMLNTAVWDAGYEGRGEGLLQVHHDIELERDARIAQLVLAEGNHDDAYDGSYQGENLVE